MQRPASAKDSQDSQVWEAWEGCTPVQRPAPVGNVIFANGCKLPKRLRDPQDRAATETSLHIKIRQGAQPSSNADRLEEAAQGAYGGFTPHVVFTKHRLIYDMPRDQTLLKACMEVRKLFHKYGTRCDPHSFDPRLHQNCPHNHYRGVPPLVNPWEETKLGMRTAQEATASCGGRIPNLGSMTGSFASLR